MRDNSAFPYLLESSSGRRPWWQGHGHTHMHLTWCHFAPGPKVRLRDGAMRHLLSPRSTLSLKRWCIAPSLKPFWGDLGLRDGALHHLFSDYCQKSKTTPCHVHTHGAMTPCHVHTYVSCARPEQHEWTSSRDIWLSGLPGVRKKQKNAAPKKRLNDREKRYRF